MTEDVIICYDRGNQDPITIAEDDRFLNLLVIGPTGCGKTSQIFVPMIFQDIMNKDVGVTVFDPKEDLSNTIFELSAVADRNIIYIDPLNNNCPKINLFKGTMNEVIRTLNTIFLSEKDDINNNYLCKTLIEKTIFLLFKYPSLIGNNLNLKTFTDFINNKDGNVPLKIQKISDSLKNIDFEIKDACNWFLNQYFKLESKIYNNTISLRNKLDDIMLNPYLSDIFTYNPINKNVLDFDLHLSNGDVVIINTRSTILNYVGQIFGELLMTLYTQSVFRRFEYNKNQGIKYIKSNFLYIDEFSSFKPVTIDLFTKGRLFRVGTTIAIQNRQLLKMCGGLDTEKEAFVIESNTRNLILFPGLNGDDASYYSKQFFNIEPAQILYRPFGQIVYRIIKNKNIYPPNIGLIFFIDETPNANSLANEYEFSKDGKVIIKQFNDTSNNIYN